MKMFTIIVLTLVVLTPYKALAWGLVELGDITFEHSQYLDGNDIYVRDGVNVAGNSLNMDFVLFDSDFFRTQIFQKSFSSEKNIVGFNFEFGTKITDAIEIGIAHTDIHVTGYLNPIYPNSSTDSAVFLRFRIYKSKQPHELW